jgi:hypothetical protein
MALTEFVSTHVESALDQALRRLSAENRRSLSAELRAALWRHVEAEPQTQTRPAARPGDVEDPTTRTSSRGRAA